MALRPRRSRLTPELRDAIDEYMREPTRFPQPFKGWVPRFMETTSPLFTGASIRGKVNAHGVDIPAWEGNTTTPEVHAIRWIRSTDGAVVAEIEGSMIDGTTNDGNIDIIARAWEVNENAVVRLTASQENEGFDAILQLKGSGEITPSVYSGLEVQLPGSLTYNILGNSDGDPLTDFVMVEDGPKNWRLEHVAVAVNVGSNAAHSVSSTVVSITGLQVGDLCFFLGAPAGSTDNRPFHFRTNPVCSVEGQITLLGFNASTSTVDPSEETFHFLVIHTS